MPKDHGRQQGDQTGTPAAPSEERFWETKQLHEMTETEWESLCDGCGKCCLHKLQEEDTGKIHHTNVGCPLLDVHEGRCQNYSKRWDYVPDCVKLTLVLLHRLTWMPKTCAYRLLAEGKPLFEWHPLISGDPESVHKAGMSVRGRSIPDSDSEWLDDHIVRWEDL